MSERRELMDKGYRHAGFGDKNDLKRRARMAKRQGAIRSYRILPYNEHYHEIYIK